MTYYSSINSIQKEYVFSICSSYGRKAVIGSRKKKIKPVIPRVIVHLFQIIDGLTFRYLDVHLPYLPTPN